MFLLTQRCAPTVASTIATRNDVELHDLFSREADIDLSFFSNNTASQYLSHFWSHGTLQARHFLLQHSRAESVTRCVTGRHAAHAAMLSPLHIAGEWLLYGQG